MSLMQKMILTCREVTEHSAMGEVGDLSATKRIKFRLHLILCKACRVYNAMMEKMSRHVESDFESYKKDHKNEVEKVKKGLKRDPK